MAEAANATAMGSLFKKVAETKANNGGVFFEPGLYIVELDALKMILTQMQVNAFIAETKILKSNVVIRPAGSSVSWYAGFDKPSTPGNIKAFFEALFPGEVIDDVGMQQAVGPENPCKGAILHVEAVQVPTKTAGGKYTKCKFRLATAEERQSVGK